MEKFIAGFYKQQLKYKSFSPNRINREFSINNPEILVLLEEAGRYLGELNAYSRLVPNIDIFIKMHIIREATLSSRIEGTQTTLEEAAMPETGVRPERRDDWAEVQNYIKAINYAVDNLKELPVSTRLIKQTHAILLSGARGKERYPGEIRRSQNWIGGSNPGDAFFVPPHYEDVPDAMSDLENFWHNKNLRIPVLVKTAIFHYQFETIHPFCDGNGRMGRLLIPLMLVEEGVLDKPSLYISYFFEKNKGSYYDSLTLVRSSNDLTQWIKFFLSGVLTSAKKGKETLEKILKLKEDVENKIIASGLNNKNAGGLVLGLFENPYTSVAEVMEKFELSRPTASKLLAKLEALGILRAGRTRPKLYLCAQYLDLFDGR